MPLYVHVQRQFVMGVKKSSCNRTVYASPPFGGSASAKHQSGYALCGVLLHHITAVAGTASQFLYRNRSYVAYNRNGIRTFPSHNVQNPRIMRHIRTLSV